MTIARRCVCLCVCVGCAGGGLFEKGDWFKYFRLRGEGDYSRKAINGGTAIIRGNTVL